MYFRLLIKLRSMKAPHSLLLFWEEIYFVFLLMLLKHVSLVVLSSANSFPIHEFLWLEDSLSLELNLLHFFPLSLPLKVSIQFVLKFNFQSFDLSRTIWNSDQLKEAEKNAQETNIDNLITTKFNGNKRSTQFRFWSIEDYAAAYRSRTWIQKCEIELLLTSLWFLF